MKKGKIIWRDGLKYPELQQYFIDEAENNTDHYIEKYKRHSSSLNGQYINSDLMKEMFDVYAESVESRRKYDSYLHNSASVLANELFIQMLNTHSFSKCIFLAGAPGVGKSFFIQSLILAEMITNDTIIFEGSIMTPQVFEKIDCAKRCGAEPSVIVINSSLELATENVINRINTIGRGASPLLMAKIFSGLPIALLQIRKKYPEIDLAIYDKKSNFDVDCLFGFESLEVLNHGSYEKILEELIKLRTNLEKSSREMDVKEK